MRKTNEKNWISNRFVCFCLITILDIFHFSRSKINSKKTEVKTKKTKTKSVFHTDNNSPKLNFKFSRMCVLGHHHRKKNCLSFFIQSTDIFITSKSPYHYSSWSKFVVVVILVFFSFSFGNFLQEIRSVNITITNTHTL